MAKRYDLVGSVYDKYAKGNKYTKEEIIKVPGVSLTTLEDIDNFTAKHNRISFQTAIGDKYNSKNTYSIRVTNNKGEVYYQKVIFNNEEIVRLTNHLENTTIHIGTGYISTKLISENSPLFIESWAVIEEYISKKKIQAINSLFNENSNFAFLIRRYINSDTSDSYTELNEIRKAFRDYKTFRKFIVNKDKLLVTNLDILENEVYEKSTTINKDKQISTTIGSTFTFTKKDNLEEDEEEFLTEDELLQMAGDGDIPKGYETYQGIRKL